MKRAQRVFWMLAVSGGFAIAGTGLAGLGGCTQSLFTSSDPYTKSRIDRYYDRDSATETSESRKQASPMGFGMPSGGSY